MSTLLDDWLQFEANILPADFGVEARRKAMFAFYSGALRVVEKLIEGGVNVDTRTLMELHVQCQGVAGALAVLSWNDPP